MIVDTDDLIGRVGYYINPYYNNKPVYVLVLRVHLCHVNVMILTSGLYLDKKDPIFKRWKPGLKRLMATNVITFI